MSIDVTITFTLTEAKERELEEMARHEGVTPLQCLTGLLQVPGMDVVVEAAGAWGVGRPSSADVRN